MKQNSPEKHWILSIMLRLRDIQLFRKRLSEKVHTTIPKGIVGCFEITVLHRNFRDHRLCFPVLKRSSKSRFYSYGVRNSVLIISHITFRDCRVHFFSDNLSRNSCIQNMDPWSMDLFVDPILAGLPLLFYCTGNHMISCAIWNK